MAKRLRIDGQLLEMTQQHAKEAAKLLTNNFITNNSIWSSFKLNQDEVFKFFEKSIIELLESQKRTRKELGDHIKLNFVNSYEGKINGLLMHYELHEYLRTKNSTAQRPTMNHFKILEEAGEKLLKSVDFSRYEKGKHLYSSFGTIDKDVPHDMKRQRYLVLAKLYRSLLKQGFRSMLGRCSSENSKKIFVNMGAEVISQETIQREGQQFKLFLIEIKFDNPLFQHLFEVLDQLQNNMRKREQKPML